MSGYLKNITITEQFDGDTVNVALRPLDLADMLAIRAATTGDGDREQALAQEFQRVLAKQIVSLSGLRDAAGGEIDVPTLCTAAYFVPLVVTLGTRLLTEAVPKNDQPPSAP